MPVVYMYIRQDDDESPTPPSPTTSKAPLVTSATPKPTSTKDDDDDDEPSTTKTVEPTTSRAVIAADTGAPKTAETTQTGGGLKDLSNKYDNCSGTADCADAGADWMAQNKWMAGVIVAIVLLIVGSFAYWCHKRTKRKHELKKTSIAATGTKTG